MSFLAPGAFALAVLLPVIIAMYLLKLLRTERVVSSVYLWRRTVRDLEANAPWQRLRRNLLLITQLLFLTALILALARPFTHAEAISRQSVILILDRSPSMAANDIPPSRLEAAKKQAQQLVTNLPEDALVTVIGASDAAQVLIASSRDRRQIQLAIDRIQMASSGSDLTAALELASAISARQPETEIVVLSDGRVTLPERLTTKASVRYLRVGQSGDNQAISALSLGPVSASGGVTAFAQVTNYGDDPAGRRLTLFTDGKLANAYDLEIPPGGHRTVVADDLPVDTQVLEAQLNGRDDLSLDDHAWAVQRNAGPTPVTLVTEGNLFLETGLALLPALQLTVMRPAEFEERWQRAEWDPSYQSEPENGEIDRPEDGKDDFTISPSPNRPTPQTTHLTIFDAYVPHTAALPNGNLFFIAPPRSTTYFTANGLASIPEPQTVEADDPLLSHVNLAEVNVLEATHLSLPAWARPVIAANVGGDRLPLLFAGEVESRRVAVLAFQLQRSDLPLQVAFPLLLANLTAWLAPGGAGDLPTQVSPGAGVAFSAPPETEYATVTRPDGSTVKLTPEAGRFVFADTAQLGVYGITWQRPQSVVSAWEVPDDVSESGQARFAVNLFSPQESDTQPAQALPIERREAMGEQEHARPGRRYWWRLLAFVGLTLLFAEWLVYHRAPMNWLLKKTRQAIR